MTKHSEGHLPLEWSFDKWNEEGGDEKEWIMDSKSEGAKGILAVFLVNSGDDALEAGESGENEKYKWAQFDYFLQNWLH